MRAKTSTKNTKEHEEWEGKNTRFEKEKGSLFMVRDAPTGWVSVKSLDRRSPQAPQLFFVLLRVLRG